MAGVALGIVFVAIWASAFTAIKGVVPEWPALWGLAARFTLVVPILLAVLAWRGARLPSRVGGPRLVGVGGFGLGVFLARGLARGAAALAARCAAAGGDGSLRHRALSGRSLAGLRDAALRAGRADLFDCAALRGAWRGGGAAAAGAAAGLGRARAGLAGSGAAGGRARPGRGGGGGDRPGARRRVVAGRRDPDLHAGARAARSLGGELRADHGGLGDAAGAGGAAGAAATRSPEPDAAAVAGLWRGGGGRRRLPALFHHAATAAAGQRGGAAIAGAAAGRSLRLGAAGRDAALERPGR